MKKFLVFAALMLALGLIAPFAGTAMAAPPIDRHQLSGSACAGGTMVVNVTMDMINDLDSAVGTPSWAVDAFNKTLQIWDEGGGTFCVLTSYNGSFVTTGPHSPNNSTLPLDGGITGSMSGGYTGHLTGATFSPNGLLATNGNIGTFDCGNTVQCPGAADWVTAYFGSTPGSGLVQSYWGWIYHTAQNGTWINQTPTNSGNITN
jgi:hypothetical protein